jgi:hypothetical protein
MAMRQVNRPAGEAAAIARLLASSMIGLQGSLALDSRNTGWTPVRGWHTTSPHASGQWWRGENPASVLEQAARLIRASYPCPRTSYRVILSSCSALRRAHTSPWTTLPARFRRSRGAHVRHSACLPACLVLQFQRLRQRDAASRRLCA